MRVLRVLLVIVLVAVGVGAVAFVVTRTSGTNAGTQYITAAASLRDVVNSAVADGSVSAATSYSLAFGVPPVPAAAPSSSSSSSSSGSSGSGSGSSSSWQVRTLSVAVGDAVKKGQTLAIADTTVVRKQLATAKSQLHAATLQVTAAQETYDGISSTLTDQRRQAQIQLINARAQRDQSQATVDNLKSTVSYGTLKAPAAGTVTAVNIQAGADAPSGVAIDIAVAPLQVTADFAESDLAVLKTGQTASVTVKALGATVDGTVKAIAPAASSSSGGVVSYTITIALTSPPAALRSGMSAQVTVVTQSATGVLAVPTSALQGSSGSYNVQVLDANGQPTLQAVSVGLISSSFAEITSGLSQGDRVVIGTSAQRTTGLPGGAFPGTGGGGGRFNGGGGGNGGGGNSGGGNSGGGNGQP